MIKVLHIGTELSWRGGENQVRLLMHGLKAHGVQSALAYPQKSQAIKRLQNEVAICPLASSKSFDPRNIVRLISFCRENNIHILDAHSSAAHSLALSVKKRLPHLKLVVHRRVVHPIKKNVLTKRKYLSPLVDQYVSISKAIENNLCVYGIEAQRVQTVYSAIETAQEGLLHKAPLPKAHARQELLNIISAQVPTRVNLHQVSVAGPLNFLQEQDPKRENLQASALNQETVFIGMASALTKEKGHKTLIAACSILKKHNANFYLLIAGSGALESELKNIVLVSGLQDSVIFLGQLNDITHFLLGLDVFVMPSELEGLGTALLEAAMAKCALVGTRVGGIPEVIADHRTGRLFSKGNEQELCQILKEFLVNKKLREELADAAHAFVLKQFSVQQMVTENLKIYKKLLA